MRATGRLIVISGPSGVGKTTVCERVLDTTPAMVRSISCTTRPPGRGEADGRDYHFLRVDDFKRRKDEGGLLEHAIVHGAYYGTPRAPIEAWIAEGKDVLLNIDVQGAEQVRRSGFPVLTIFLLPPSLDILRKRIQDRARESAERIANRLAQAEREMAEQDRYDHRVVNDDLERAVAEIREIITDERTRAAAAAASAAVSPAAVAGRGGGGGAPA